MIISRRSLMGGGAALIGAGALARLGGTNDNPVVPELTGADLAALDIPVMLTVRDSSTGAFEILIGEQAIEFTDRGLMAKLARAARAGAV